MTQNINSLTNALRFPIALAQAKGGNTSENLLNETCQIIYSFYLEREITKKVYNNIMN